MSQTRRIAVIVGSLRAGSLNRRTAEALARLAPEGLALEIVEIGDLPLYNQDFDDDPPQQWRAFRDRIRGFDGVLFVTPEYNRGLPAALKNAVDVGSRPYGHSVWAGKPAGVVSVSPGGLGGFGANHQLRQSLVFLDMPVLQQPEAYFGGAGSYFDEAGALANDATRAVMQRFIDAYGEWVEKILGAIPAQAGKDAFLLN
jgi:chromate reductase